MFWLSFTGDVNILHDRKQSYLKFVYHKFGAILCVTLVLPLQSLNVCQLYRSKQGLVAALPTHGQDHLLGCSTVHECVQKTPPCALT